MGILFLGKPSYRMLDPMRLDRNSHVREADTACMCRSHEKTWVDFGATDFSRRRVCPQELFV